MLDPKQVVILSVPYCEPYPMVAPVLLSACLNRAGITSKGIDFSILFLEHFSSKPYYVNLKNFLTSYGMGEHQLDRHVFREVLKFTRKFLLDLVDQHQPEYIGLSIFSIDSLDFGLFFAYCIRRYCPGVKIIAGGKGLEIPHLNREYHYEIWHRNGVADIIVVGDAEIEIIDSIRQGKTGIVHAQQQTKDQLDAIPVPQWQEYDLYKYQKFGSFIDAPNQTVVQKIEPYMAITGSKGCVRQCTFCDVIKFQPKYIYRDPARVAEEIIHNYQHTGINRFHFTDNLINGSISNYRRMNEILAATVPGEIKYQGYAIFRGQHQMPERDFELAAAAGCVKWVIGVESGSERVRTDMKKKFTNSDIDWSVEMLVKYKIDQVWLLMVGYPTETDDDFNDTRRLLEKYQALARDNQVLIGLTPTFMLTTNAPLLSDALLAESHGVAHNLDNQDMAKFWTSTVNPSNTYQVRSRRYKELLDLIDTRGFNLHQGMTLQKSLEEIKHLDQLYHEKQNKIIAIHPAS